MPDGHRLLVTLSGEIHTKSRRTSRWFRRLLLANLESAFAVRCPDAAIVQDGQRVYVEHPTDLAAAAEVAATVFGVHRVELGRDVAAGDLEALVAAVHEHAQDRVRGRTFAVRVHRRGRHDWSSMDACDRLGAALLDDSAGVDLDDPEVEVRVEVYGPVAFVPVRAWEGPAGLPLGTQEPVLSLLSGGFDSPVAAWMMMRRGSPVHFVHFMLDCAASDHALVVAHELWRRWGAGSSPTVWKIDFQPVKEALFERTPSRLRQVILKQLMFDAADRLAEQLGLDALVTGESVGQVSSQTVRHLAEIDAMVDRTVLRPLAGFTKDEIIDRARTIGTSSLSARAKEVCDLSDGPVAVAARTDTLDRARRSLPDDLVAVALDRVEVVSLEHWTPGAPLVPVADAPGAGTVALSASDQPPPRGTLALRGLEQVARASGLRATGRDVQLVLERAERTAARS